jgi:hypothetical protein
MIDASASETPMGYTSRSNSNSMSVPLLFAAAVAAAAAAIAAAAVAAAAAADGEVTKARLAWDWRGGRAPEPPDRAKGGGVGRREGNHSCMPDGP